MGLSLVGCQPEADPFLDLVDARKGTDQGNDLERTMSLAVSDSSYDYRQYEEKISGGLNRWIRLAVAEGGEAADDSQQWNPDAEVRKLVEQYKDVPAIAAFDKREFVSTDPYFIRERSWMKLIADRVCRSTQFSAMELYRLQAGDFLPEAGQETAAAAESPNATGQLDEARKKRVDALNRKQIEQLFVRLNPELPETTAIRLADAALLFDWTTRNILLDQPLVPSPSERPGYQLVSDGDGLTDPAMGIPGLGYRRFLWQILVYGRGDYVEKARLFSGLCRQRGIDTVLLYAGDQPWAVAALIDGQAWLFDTRLGLPIPGRKPGQIATLAQVLEDGSMLESLDLTVAETNRDDSRYWVRPDQLKSLRAEILATPESLSRRMTFLENRLLGEQRLALTDNVEALMKEAARVLPGVNLSVSTVGFMTHQFRRVVGESLKRASFDDVIGSKLAWYYQEESYIDQFVDYRSARNLFFIGRFETERDSRKMSAVQGFFSLMYPDEMIANIGVDTPRLNRLGIYKLKGQTAAEFEERLRGVQANMRLVRRDVGIFLSQSHFDNGNVSSAGNWLEKVQNRDDTSRWTPIIKYLRGRAYESSGDYDNALKMYRESDGPQFLGDYLRARLLSRAMEDAGMSGKKADAEAADESAPAKEDPAKQDPAKEDSASPTGGEASVPGDKPADPAGEKPASDTPTAASPAADTPTVDTPAAETPKPETPAAEPSSGGQSGGGEPGGGG